MKARSLLLAGIAALLPAGVAWGGTAGAPELHASFVPPAQDIILTRTVWRDLHDGKRIKALRRYALRFTAQPAGYRVDASLIDTVVEAPPQLALLAEIERRRGDAATFVLQLDPLGRILAEEAPARAATHRQLAGSARGIIAGAPLSAGERAQTAEMLGQLLAASAGSGALPADLFNPAVVQSRESRRIALPGGGEGEVEIELTVSRPGASALPERFERTITTTLGGARRVSREEFLIGPAAS